MDDDLWRAGAGLLSRSLTAVVYSNPPFAMEALVGAAVCAIYAIVHRQLGKLRAVTARAVPSAIFVGERLKGEDSSTTIASCFRKVTRSDCSLRSRFTVGSRLADAPEQAPNNTEEKIDTVLRLTPEEYLNQMTPKSEFHACLKSLSSLYEDCVKGGKSEKELRKQLTAAKGSLGQDSVKCLGKNAQYLTRSLFDLLEKMVVSGSMENRLPSKGDLSNLGIDAGNLDVKKKGQGL